MLEVANVYLADDCTDGFNHAFSADEITVVLGANRSGKTNLCRLIAGLHTRAHGSVFLDGSDIAALSPRHRPVSLVYQAFVNYPNLSVSDNIASPLRARRVPGSARRKQVEELADRLRISELLDRMPHELSGGQQQRLAIARALAKNARVLLLDEPLVNLDFKLREALEYELRDLLRDSNVVVIYTSSDPRDAFALGDLVLLLERGRKIQAGKPIDVYQRPSSFAAMELLAEPRINRFSRSGESLALRPEHVEIGDITNRDREIGFEMTVTASETNGDESFIHGRVHDHDWVVRSRGLRKVQVGTKLRVHARNDDIVGF